MKDMKTLDLSGLPVADNHCHFFHLTPEEIPLARRLSMSLRDMPPDQLENTLVYRLLLRELRRFLKVDGPAEKVLAARRERLKADYRGYVADLFAEAGIACLILDTGYRPVKVDLAEFEAFVRAEVRYVFRLESVLDDLWERVRDGALRFEAAEELFQEAVDRALSAPKTVALKTIIGYRTGLEILPVPRGALVQGPPEEKPFRDYLIREAVVRAADRGVPVQVHAAFGESNIDLRRNNPALLKTFLDDPEVGRARLILVHGGYPHCFEAGYLAAVHPNVYVDLSEMIPFAPRAARHGLRQIFDLCPFNKILYGSDGFVIPEIHWLGARTAKDLLAGLLSEYVADGLFTEEEALETARMILHDNALALYGLGAS
ncbi:MAG: amidohydrolase family protein [Thermodesulfobacteriota bacterium]